MTDLTATLAELKALLEKATPGPWNLGTSGHCALALHDAADEPIVIGCGGGGFAGRTESLDPGDDDTYLNCIRDPAHPDLALIVALVNAAPALIAAAERNLSATNLLMDEAYRAGAEEMRERATAWIRTKGFHQAAEFVQSLPLNPAQEKQKAEGVVIPQGGGLSGAPTPPPAPPCPKGDETGRCINPKCHYCGDSC